MLARLITHVTFKDGSGFFVWDIPIDHEIPFVGFFVIPYIGAFIYWLIFPFVIYGVMGKKVFYRFVALTFLAEFIGFLWLIILPAKMSHTDYLNRSNYADDPFYGLMDKMVYQNDLPDNLAPSFHTLCTLLPFMACCNRSHKNKHNMGMIFGSGVAFVLVALSTLFVRQHYVVDIFSACLVAGIAYLIIRIWKWEGFFQKFNESWMIKMHWMSTNRKSQKHHKQILVIILLTICFMALLGGMLYFSAVSTLTGDPFQCLWQFGLNDLWSN
ncbi:MAG: phosphatase PAP2 family protein [Mycoplasmataceae bacterium]|nr:phosphatase PAP2 family protein [Mycoplasmataceae bacterium]